MTAETHAPRDQRRLSGMGPSLCYVRLSSPAPAKAVEFFAEEFGLRAGATPHQAVLGLGDRAHSLAFATETSDRVGVALPSEVVLERVLESLRDAGLPTKPITDAACAARSIKSGWETKDASGNLIELVIRPGFLGAPPSLDQCGGITGLAAVALRSTDIDADRRIWTELLGADVADRAGDIVYLAQDEAHHRIALYPSSGNGVLYTSLGLTSFDKIMQTHYALQARQVEAVHGPGREASSGQYFLRFFTTGGHLISFVHGESRSGQPPRQFVAHASSLCALGSVCDKVPELSFASAATAARNWSGS